MNKSEQYQNNNCYEGHERRSQLKNKREDLSFLGSVGRVVLVAALSGLLIGKGCEAFAGPKYPQKQAAYRVESGDGLWNAARAVKNPDEVDMRKIVEHIQSMPENKLTLSDGLQPGEVLIIPDSVKK